jgi:alpha-tubulin suppressor-like RCC1 family protein
MLEARIEQTPKQVKGLESIGYIAAGKNHSVAIRTYKRRDKELQMYTWGCGWHGQTGQGMWQNIYEPKIVRVAA